MSRAGFKGRRLWPAFALAVALALPHEAAAQFINGPAALTAPSLPAQPSPGASLWSPGTSGGLPPGAQNPGATILPPPPPVRPGEGALSVTARFGKDSAGRDLGPITGGLDWRVYADHPDNTGMFRLIKEDKSAAPTFTLPPGGYIVNVAFGSANAVKPVQVRSDGTRETFDIAAGGLRLEGRVGDAKILPGQITFDVYKGSQFDTGEKRKPVVAGVQTQSVVLVPEGNYYIVSNYGDGNSVVRSDVRVQTGKLTDIAVTHRAAVITLKLVGEKGGEALANTAWSVLTPAGDVIKESIGAFPRVVLAEGEYRAVARNEGSVYQREFKVVTGVDGEVEVLAK